MSKCGLFSNHKLVLTSGGRIKCEKCWGTWDFDGRELIPYGFPNWIAWRDDCMKNNRTPAYAPETHWSGRNPLTPCEVARVLVEELITRNRLQDQAEIKALRNEAAQNSEVFIDQVLARNQP